MATKLTRKELYGLLWSEPTRTIAARFGISGGALIAVPSRGYWAKRQAGKKVIQIPLPPRPPGMDGEVYIGSRGNRWSYWPDDKVVMGPLPDPPSFDEPIEALRDRARKIIGRVHVPGLEPSCHPAIRRLLDADERRRQDQKN